MADDMLRRISAQAQEQEALRSRAAPLEAAHWRARAKVQRARAAELLALADMSDFEAHEWQLVANEQGGA